MKAVVLIDTSIFLNVLDVPGWNQDRQDTASRMKGWAEEGAHFLLPFATVVETGNHIAQLPDGGRRRTCADHFAVIVRKALRNEVPWRPVPWPDAPEIEAWLADFPDRAAGKVGMADLSIIKQWEVEVRRHPGHRVLIWSLDSVLAAHDRRP